MLLRVEAAPRAATATEAEGQIAGLTDGRPASSSGVTVRLRMRDAVTQYGSSARIAGRVEVPIGVELPRLVGQPCEYAAFDRREVGADQHMPGAAPIIEREMIADHGQRRAELTETLAGHRPGWR